jgi:hypothetical protein
MDAIDSLGILFKAASNTADRTRLTNSRITQILRGSAMSSAAMEPHFIIFVSIALSISFVAIFVS